MSEPRDESTDDSSQPSSDKEDDLGLGEFLAPADDQGLSLDALSRTYAQLLGAGEDPYVSPDSDETPEEGEGVDKAASDDESPSSDNETKEPPSAPLDLAAEDAAVSPTSILEAILFVGHPDNVPLTNKQIAALMRGVSPREIDDLVADLNHGYDESRSACRITSVGAGYRLELRPELAALRDKFHGRVKAARLSQSAVDVLAIVAYHQPIRRDEVERLRGKAVGGVLAQLVRRELLSLERPEKKPRIPIYRTTERFLDLFGMESLDDLPRSHEVGRPD